MIPLRSTLPPRYNPKPVSKPPAKVVYGSPVLPPNQRYAGPGLSHKIPALTKTVQTVSPYSSPPASSSPSLWGQQLANGRTAAYNTQNAGLITFLDDADTFLNGEFLGLPIWMWIMIGIAITAGVIVWLAL